MREQQTGITDSELEIMKILWLSAESVSTNEIVVRLKEEKGWDRSTVRTLIKRLVEKGAAVEEKEGVLKYRAGVAEDEYAREQTRGLAEKLFRGSVKNMVASLVGSRQLSKEDIQELRAYLESEEGE